MSDEQTARQDAPGEADAEGQPTESPQAGAAAQAPADPAARLAELEAELAEARREAEAQRDQSLRTRADMDNLRKRTERDVENAHKYALERFALELLPVRDSLELGLAAAGDEAADVARLREGTELTLKMLTAALEKSGIVEIAPQGEKFNPDLHQAMATQPSGEVEPGSVLTVYQKGYTLNERLLRPALVIVSAAPPAPAGGDDAPAGT